MSGFVTLQDKSQNVEKLQLAIFHVCLDVFTHQRPNRTKEMDNVTCTHINTNQSILAAASLKAQTLFS